MHVQGDLSYIGLLTIFALIVALVFAASKLSGRMLVVLFGGGLFMSMLIFGFRNSSFQQQPHPDPPSAVTNPPAQVSTLEMWEHLHRPRIVLDGDEKEAADAAVADDTTEIAAEQVKRIESDEPPPVATSQKNRPSWVDNSPKRVGNVYRVVVTSGPYKTESECYQSLAPQLSEVVKQRIEQLIPGSHAPGLEQLGIGLEYVLRDLCTEAWVDTSEASFGQMQHVHVLMQFGATQDEQLKETFRRFQQTGRIAGVGTSAAGVVASLMLLYGLLQVDTVTKGYYSKRLFFGVPAVIIALVALFSLA